MVFNNDGYMVIEGGARVVIARNNPDAITQLGTGGRIVSEAETDYIQWNLGNTAAGAFTIPFTRVTPSVVEIPLTFTINSAGDAGGRVYFSTYRGGWDNNLYKPAEITNMQGQDGDPNNSENVVDRFWILEPNNYTTKPATEINFTYIDDEHTAASNSITEGSLFAQRWNSSTNQWGDWFGTFGTANTVNNTVSSGAVTAANFFRVWTLVDQDNPLPVELLSFTATCLGEKAYLQWTTVSESNNDYFTIERLTTDLSSDEDGNWIRVGTVKGAGNSSTIRNYFFTDESHPSPFGEGQGVGFYRLSQTDFDGTNSAYSPVTSYPCNGSMVQESIRAYLDQEKNIAIEIISDHPFEGTACLYDMALKKIVYIPVHAPGGISYTILGGLNICPGIYVLSVADNYQTYTQKLSIR
ncbi:MAG: hypothetical protein HYY40_14155 [Bacteroidetes bacterium]|nr:hypothetical protein [Bacteroidota bacterium]